MQDIYSFAPAIVLAAILALLAFSIIRVISFRPTTDKEIQLKNLNDTLAPFGFAYNYVSDYFYSLKDCWQRDYGYCSLYDEGSPYFNMIMNCEPIKFSYGGKRWLIELWKGQYGITTGAEIGIYNTDKDDIKTEKFSGTLYNAITNEEQMKMSFVLKKNGKVLLKRRDHHWWITAFKLGEFSETDELSMIAKITFPEKEMKNAFLNALIDTGYQSSEYSVRFNTVLILFTNPHSPQPKTQKGLQKKIVQGINKNNCELFNSITQNYTDTMDKIEYMTNFAPDLYKFMLHSLYEKELFSLE